MTETPDMSQNEKTHADLEALISELKDDSIGQEHRLVQVVRNAYWALIKKEGWSNARRLEAGAALIRYFFLNRAAVVLTVGLGGLLALHASFMLAEQNRKLDLQNYLAIVSGELAEAQRNSQFVQLINPVMAEVQAEIAKTEPGYQNRYTLSDQLGIRIALLTQTFQPYRWTHRDMVGDDLMKSSGEGWFFQSLSAIEKIYQKGFGQSKFTAQLNETKVPVMTQNRMSPERGLLLSNLHALRVDFQSLTRWNISFEAAYAPSANLTEINLKQLEGPGAGRFVDLSLANLSGASIDRASLSGVSFMMSNLTLTDFTASDCTNARFEAATIDQANFFGARLNGAKFDHAQIENSDFALANLARADLSDAYGSEEAKFSEACLSAKSTLMPKSFDWQRYTLPARCCEHWKGDHEVFSVNAQGLCEARG